MGEPCTPLPSSQRAAGTAEAAVQQTGAPRLLAAKIVNVASV